MIDTKALSQFMADLALVDRFGLLGDFERQAWDAIRSYRANERDATPNQILTVDFLTSTAERLLGESRACCRAAAHSYVPGDRGQMVAKLLRQFVRSNKLEDIARREQRIAASAAVPPLTFGSGNGQPSQPLSVEFAQ